MANFCGKCGSRLDAKTGLCPKCSRKNPRKGLVFLLVLIPLLAGIVCTFSYFGMIQIPFSAGKDAVYNLEEVNQKCITIEEVHCDWDSDTTGTATILIRLPDYKSIFAKASASKNPGQSIMDVLLSGDYETKEYEKRVDAIMEDGKRNFNPEDVIDQIMEQELIDAINALSEGDT